MALRSPRGQWLLGVPLQQCRISMRGAAVIIRRRARERCVAPQPHANETALVAAASANQQTHRESVCVCVYYLHACSYTSVSVCLSSLPLSSIHSSLERGHVFVYLRGFMLPCRLCVFDVCLPVTVYVLCESTCVCERPQDLATAEDPAEAKHRCLFIDLVGPECLYVIQ